MISRRHLLAGAAGGAALPFLARAASNGPAFEVVHTQSEWKKLLTARQFQVLRLSATEAPFSSPLLEEHRKGLFTCAGCDRDLYSSTTKYESETGWPSFWQPLPGAVGTTRDISLGDDRTAVHCSRCGGHLGHVFQDGPRPTGLRYCMNGVALTFRPGA